MNYYYLFNSDKVFYINESLAVCGANDDSITVSTDDRYLFYCYLNTLIGLINDFNIELPKEQGKNLRKKFIPEKNFLKKNFKIKKNFFLKKNFQTSFFVLFFRVTADGFLVL